MFIRTKLKANNKISVQIVESVRSGNKVSQKIICHVGVAEVNDEKILTGLKQLAQTKIEDLLKQQQLQSELFDKIEPTKRGRKLRKELKDIVPPEEVALTDVKEEKRIVEGVDEIGGAAYDALGYNEILQRGASKLLKDLVLARIVYPYSKHKLWQVLFEQFGKEYNLNQIYRLMDQIHPQINKIKQITCTKTQELMPKADVVLFDVTTLHFESVEADEIREYGYSKNFRFNTTQVVLALATNEVGLPIGYELFSGNTAEVTTLVTAIESWKQWFDIKSVCFVGDRAMFSSANLELLESRGYSYVIAAKLRKLSEGLRQDILDEKNYRLDILNNQVSWIGEFKYKNENQRIIATYSATRAINDIKHREQILDSLKPKTGKADKLIKNDAKRYVKVEAGKTSLDADKIANDELWDGMHGIITNIKNKSAKELLGKYHSLWHIEEAFRINKHNLKMRPIYHWTKERIESHIALCYMSFAVLKRIQYQVELTQIRFSPQDVMELMLNVQSSIHVHKKTGDRYRLPGAMSHNARCLYKAFRVERSLDASVYLP